MYGLLSRRKTAYRRVGWVQQAGSLLKKAFFYKTLLVFDQKNSSKLCFGVRIRNSETRRGIKIS